MAFASKTNRERKRGFSLIEALLVLAVVAAVVLLGVNRYQQNKKDTDIAIVRQNIDLLFNAMNTYYYANCVKDVPFSISMNDLAQANLMPNLKPTTLLKAVYPSGTNQPDSYQISAHQINYSQSTNTGDIAPGGAPIYGFTIMVQLNIPTDQGTLNAQMPYFRQRLDATAIVLTTNSQNTQSLIWERLPTYQAPSTSNDLWVSDSGLRYFKEAVLIQKKGTDTSCTY